MESVGRKTSRRNRQNGRPLGKTKNVSERGIEDITNLMSASRPISLRRSLPGSSAACFVYATLFATGYLIYGRLAIGLVCAAVSIAAAFGLWRTIPKVGFWTA
jgi:hypothetical protein